MPTSVVFSSNTMTKANHCPKSKQKERRRNRPIFLPFLARHDCVPCCPHTSEPRPLNVETPRCWRRSVSVLDGRNRAQLMALLAIIVRGLPVLGPLLIPPPSLLL